MVHEHTRHEVTVCDEEAWTRESHNEMDFRTKMEETSNKTVSSFLP